MALKPVTKALIGVARHTKKAFPKYGKYRALRNEMAKYYRNMRKSRGPEAARAHMWLGGAADRKQFAGKGRKV